MKIARNYFLLIMFSLTLVFMPGTAQDKSAPDFVLPTLDGENFQLSENLGSGPVLINFWATWCLPCLSEMKQLKKIYQQYEDRGLQILSISIDDTRTVGSVRKMVRSRRFPFTILLDTNSEVFKMYQGTNPPLSLLIDNAGNIVYTHSGYRKGDEKKVEKEILALLETESESE